MKYAVGLWLFGRLRDRFAEYHPPRSLAEKIAVASEVKKAQGVEVVYPLEFGDNEIDAMRSLLRRYRVRPAGLIVDLYTRPKWTKGSLTSRDLETRRAAIELAGRAMGVAKELGFGVLTLWLGQDGYDYSFQSDYNRAWTWLVEGIRQIAKRDPSLRVGIEYKPKEPRTHSYISTVGKALLLVNEVDLKNVGVTLDIGHALCAQENPAESVALLHQYGKLFHVHFNDNYRDWDHDMLPASVNVWDSLEVVYWLHKIDYRGWISLDIYPYREDAKGACERSIENLELLNQLLAKVGVEHLERWIATGDALEIAAALRRAFAS